MRLTNSKFRRLKQQCRNAVGFRKNKCSYWRNWDMKIQENEAETTTHLLKMPFSQTLKPVTYATAFTNLGNSPFKLRSQFWSRRNCEFHNQAVQLQRHHFESRWCGWFSRHADSRTLQSSNEREMLTHHHCQQMRYFTQTYKFW